MSNLFTLLNRVTFNDLFVIQSEAESKVEQNGGSDTDDEKNKAYDPHYEPIVELPLVPLTTNEEEEVELCNLRARLYRYDMVDHEWKVIIKRKLYFLIFLRAF